MIRRKLPTGIQTFREIRESNCYYVDKTAYMSRMVDEGKHYFLSRPRRFGKSLFLDTLKELFEGSEEFFEGLAIHERWDWSARRPVVRLSFAKGDFGEPDYLRQDISAQFDSIERRFGVRSDYGSAPVRFAHLIETLHRQSGRRVVVLVDEYDRPILDALDDPDTAVANRRFLRGLYGTVKDCDADIKMTFITGVAKFPKVSLFSTLNNLTDLTLHPGYGAICGYTDADLDEVFAPELPGLDRDRIRRWYNGYRWLDEESVYNPYDVLNLFGTREFRNHWFQTGTPGFLVDTLFERNVASLAIGKMSATEDMLSSFDIGAIGTEALLFQTGYLTVREASDIGGMRLFRLGYPNLEVRQSLNRQLLAHAMGSPRRELEQAVCLYGLLRDGDLAGLEAHLRAFFASIPHQWHTKNPMGGCEGWYASVLYSHFAALDLDVTAEESTSGGRLDMAVACGGQVFLFEFKMVERASEGSALAQLRARGYAEKYRAPGRPVHLVGIEFSRATRNLAAFEAAPA